MPATVLGIKHSVSGGKDRHEDMRHRDGGGGQWLTKNIYKKLGHSSHHGVIYSPSPPRDIW